MSNPISQLFKLQAEYVMRGRREAMLMALMWTIVPLMAWLGAAIMALITLRKGAKEGFLILLWTSVPNAVLAFVNPKAHMAFLIGILGGNLVVWLLALVLRQASSWRQVLQVAAVLGIIAVLIVHGSTDNITEHWYQMYNDYMRNVDKTSAMRVAEGKWQYMFQYLAKLTTGICTVMLLLINLSNLFIARWMQALLYNPGALAEELLQIRLSRIFDVLLGLNIAAIFLGIDLAWDILPIILFVYLLAGISLFHAVIAKIKAGWGWIISFYVVLIIFYEIVPWIIMVAALMDTWLDFRRRLTVRGC
jgi:hypothetical protein